MSEKTCECGNRIVLGNSERGICAVCEQKIAGTWDEPFANQLFREWKELKRRLSVLPGDWEKDSSLETWFPISADELKRLRAENAELRARLSCSGYLSASANPGKGNV